MNAISPLSTLPAAGILFPGAPTTSSTSPCAGKPDWQLVAETLPVIDASCEFFTMRDLAPFLGPCTPGALSRHAADLFPNYEGYYRLSTEEAIKLIKRYCRVGNRLHPRAELERRWAEKQVIFN